MRYTVLLILSIFCFTLKAQYCDLNQRFTEAEAFAESDIEINTNVTYGVAQNWLGGTDTLKYDWFTPKSSVDTLSFKPAVIIIHGGAFQTGNRTQWHRDCIEFAKRGYVAFSIGYRLGWNTTIERIKAIYRANQDANAALRHIVNNRITYGVDTNWIFIGGGSAGSICSFNVIYSSQSEWNTTLPTIEQQLGGLHNSGNSLTNTYTIKGMYNNWGAIVLPHMQVDEHVPTISFHGEQDTIVSVDTGEAGLIGSRVIHNELIANAICSDFTLQPNGGHGIYTNASGDAFRAGRTSCFFKSIMCNSCNDFYATTAVDAACALTTNAKKLANNKEISVYPNPFYDRVFIRNAPPNARFRLINTLGTTLDQTNQTEDLNLKQLPTGIYYLVIESKSNYSIKRIVKR